MFSLSFIPFYFHMWLSTKARAMPNSNLFVWSCCDFSILLQTERSSPYRAFSGPVSLPNSSSSERLALWADSSNWFTDLKSSSSFFFIVNKSLLTKQNSKELANVNGTHSNACWGRGPGSCDACEPAVGSALRVCLRWSSLLLNIDLGNHPRLQLKPHISPVELDG